MREGEGEKIRLQPVGWGQMMKDLSDEIQIGSQTEEEIQERRGWWPLQRSLNLAVKCLRADLAFWGHSLALLFVSSEHRDVGAES